MKSTTLILTLSYLIGSTTTAAKRKPRSIYASLDPIADPLIARAYHPQDLICEGFHYFAKEGRQFDFLQVAIELLEENEGGDLNVDMDFMNVVASSMDGGVSEDGKKILNLAMEMRQYGQICATSYLRAMELFEFSLDAVVPEVFAVVYKDDGSRKVLTNVDDFKTELASTNSAENYDISSDEIMIDLENDFMESVLILGEDASVLGEVNSIIVVYGKINGAWWDIYNKSVLFDSKDGIGGRILLRPMNSLLVRNISNDVIGIYANIYLLKMTSFSHP